MTGGNGGIATESCDHIYQIQLAFPCNEKTLFRMPEPRRDHCTEIFDDNLFIIGGRRAYDFKDTVSSVVLYDLKKNVWKQLPPLLYGVSEMATVRWHDKVVVMGGIDKDGQKLNKVFTYNVKTGQTEMLPSMKCKRFACTAVLIQNNIVVMGGKNERRQVLKSVEAFNLETNTWQDLPDMSEKRWFHTAVVI